MQHPDPLRPQSTQPIILPSGREVELPRAMPVFRRWTGAMPTDTFNGKPVLDFNGEMAFAELVILGLFQRDGWDGRWIDSYRRKYRIGYWGQNVTKDLPPSKRSTLDLIRPEWGGCFDVFCWRGETILFAEAKWKAHDRIRPTQRAWLEAALDAGISVESFLVVEWSIEL